VTEIEAKRLKEDAFIVIDMGLFRRYKCLTKESSDYIYVLLSYCGKLKKRKCSRLCI